MNTANTAPGALHRRLAHFGILFGLGVPLVLMSPAAAMLIDAHDPALAWITASILIIAGTASLVFSVVVTLPSWRARTMGFIAIAFLVPFLILMGAVLHVLLFIDFEFPVR